MTYFTLFRLKHAAPQPNTDTSRAPMTVVRGMESQIMNTTARHSRFIESIAVAALAVGFCTAFAPSASASCGPTLKPRIAGVNWSQSQDHVGVVLAAYGAPDRDVSIVGLWKVEFLIDGEVFDRGFDAWHADGTETLNDSVPPTSGNVCLGVWDQTGRRTYRLKHPSWNYDADGVAIGTVVLREVVELDKSGNRYQGALTFDVLDMNDNLLFRGSGTITGKRITPDR